MATVSSFQEIRYPKREELRQFAELFLPLYRNSSIETRRQVAAALASSSALPDSICFFLGSQPITIAAPFLTSSRAISEETLISIARTQGPAHARAIAKREELSPTLVDALAALHNGSNLRHSEEGLMSAAQDRATAEDQAREEARQAREEALRDTLRELGAMEPAEQAVAATLPVLKGLSGLNAALLVRFSRDREASYFASTLADALDSSRGLAERIMLDVSGRQLATTLIALGTPLGEARQILCSFYPHLLRASDGRTHAQEIISTLTPVDCVERVEAWRRADHFTIHGDAVDAAPQAANLDDGFAFSEKKQA